MHLRTPFFKFHEITQFPHEVRLMFGIIPHNLLRWRRYQCRSMSDYFSHQHRFSTSGRSCTHSSKWMLELKPFWIVRHSSSTMCVNQLNGSNTDHTHLYPHGRVDRSGCICLLLYTTRHVFCSGLVTSVWSGFRRMRFSTRTTLSPSCSSSSSSAINCNFSDVLITISFILSKFTIAALRALSESPFTLQHPPTLCPSR